MTRSESFLSNMLLQVAPAQLSSTTLRWLEAFRDELQHYVLGNFPLEAIAGPPETLGSREKGTDICLGYGLTLLLPFRAPYEGGHVALRRTLLYKLRQRYSGPGLEVRDHRVSLGLRVLHGVSTLDIDLIPALEAQEGGYDAHGPEEAREVHLYDRISGKARPANLHRQARLLRSKLGPYGDVVRLLKAWRYRENHPVSGYALELLAYRARGLAKAPQTGSLPVLLAHTLEASVGFLDRNGLLHDLGSGAPWADYLKPAAKRQLAERWRGMMAALDRKDIQELRTYFP